MVLYIGVACAHGLGLAEQGARQEEVDEGVQVWEQPARAHAHVQRGHPLQVARLRVHVHQGIVRRPIRAKPCRAAKERQPYQACLRPILTSLTSDGRPGWLGFCGPYPRTQKSPWPLDVCFSTSGGLRIPRVRPYPNLSISAAPQKRLDPSASAPVLLASCWSVPCRTGTDAWLV